MPALPRVLTIAGSDSGGGAGIQADLKTFSAYRTFGMSAIAALTAQNTVGVQGIHPIPDDFVAAQIESVVSDIGVDAVKTGMLGSASTVKTVASCVREWEIHPLVVDPVMVAKSGDTLLDEDAVGTLIEDLLPLTTVLTPNLPEAEIIADNNIETPDDMKQTAEFIRDMGPEVVVLKGGHLDGESAVDIFCDESGIKTLSSQRTVTKNTHGTGCTFASAIAAGLARGWEPLMAVKSAKSFISEAIKYSLDLGQGHGPTNHLVRPLDPDGREVSEC